MPETRTTTVSQNSEGQYQVTVPRDLGRLLRIEREEARVEGRQCEEQNGGRRSRQRITDGSTESCRCRRRSAADATTSPSLRWLARSVVSGGIGRQVADSRGRPDAPRGRPRSSSNHIDELLVRPPPEATPASAGASPHTRSEGTARRSVRGDSPPRTAAVPLDLVLSLSLSLAQTSDKLDSIPKRFE